MTRIGSLCTGYGGLDEGIRSVLGGELAWVADNDPGAAAILAHRFPSVKNHGDITIADWSAPAPVDVLTAGFPCQDVSCAGGRAGLREGNRTGVWAHVARAIDELRPSLVVLENVRGLLNAGADSDVESCPWCLGEAGNEHPLRALGAVLGDLADLGYDARWAVVSAAGAGAPHRRERVFIVGWPAADADSAPRGRYGTGSGPGPLQGTAIPERTPQQPGRLHSGGRDTSAVAPEDADRAAGGQRRLAAPGQAAGGRPRADAGGSGGVRAAADARGAGLEVGAVEPDRDERQAAERGRGDAPADTARHGRDKVGAESAWANGRPEPADGDGPAADASCVGHGDAGTAGERGVPAAAVSGAPADAEGSAWGEPEPEHLATATGRAAEPGERPGAIAWGAYEPAIRRWEAATGRHAPPPTEPGRTGQRLSPAFVEWLMGLPEGWVTDVPGLSRNAQLKALGNGVVPQQAAMALRLLLNHVDAERAA